MKSRCVQKKNHKKSRGEVKKSGEKTNKKKSRVVFGSRKKILRVFPVKSRKKNNKKKKKLVDGTGTIGEKRKRTGEEAEKKGESFVSLQPSDYDEKKNNIVKFPNDLIAKSTFLSNAIEGVEGDIGVIPVPIDYSTLVKINSILTRNLRSKGRNKPLDDYVDLLMATQYFIEELYNEILNEMLSEKDILDILSEAKYRYKLNQYIINELISKLSPINKVKVKKENDISRQKYDYILEQILKKDQEMMKLLKKKLSLKTYQKDILKKIQYIKDNLETVSDNDIMEYVTRIKNYLNSLLLSESYSVIGKKEKSAPRFLPEDTTIPSVFDDSDRTLPSLFYNDKSPKAMWRITRKNGEIVTFERPLWFYYHSHLDNNIPVFIGNVAIMSKLFEW